MAAQAPSRSRPAPGLYVHVPFCAAICNYCNFNRGLLDEPVRRQFVSAVVAEMRMLGAGRDHAAGADTLYFGGGTPSLLEPHEVTRIITEARVAFELSPDAEVTLEANPESAGQPRLSAFLDAGVNRISIGVQSFDDRELTRLDRRHTAATARDAVRAARGAGCTNLSLDLMMGLPGQRPDGWRASVDAAIDLGPDHLSLYILEIYPHLPLRADMDRHHLPEPIEDDVVAMYHEAMERLACAGYRQYEISNVCRPGFESRHNLKYWTDGEWWAFGPGAHSTIGGVRRRNVASTAEYIERMANGRGAAAEERWLSPDERIGDAMFTGLRLTDGIDLRDLSERYGTDVWNRFEQRLSPYLEAGLLSRQDTRLRLTQSGMLLANEVMSVFV